MDDDATITIRGVMCGGGPGGRWSERVDDTMTFGELRRIAQDYGNERMAKQAAIADQPALLDLDQVPAVEPEPSRITARFHRMLRDLDATGQDQRVELHGGAVLVLGRRAGDLVLTIKRQGKPIGADEERTFRRDCLIPPAAVRIPQFGLNKRQEGPRVAEIWQWLAYRWPDTTLVPEEEA